MASTVAYWFGAATGKLVPFQVLSLPRTLTPAAEALTQ
jgi:hypothetical protein